MPVTEDEVREMLVLLDQYKYRVEALQQQLGLLTNTESELGAAWDFLESFEDIQEGTSVMVPVGGGVLVSAQVTGGEKVLTAVGDDIFTDMDPKRAAQRIGERRDQVREMIQQLKSGIERTEQSALALQQQAEAAFQELQQSRSEEQR